MPVFSKDKSWLRQSMILPKRAIDEVDAKRRTFTSGLFGYQDTTLGGNQAINPWPQYCEFADMNSERFFPTIGKGMGRYYEENINANAVLVHLRFGVPAFNSLTQFFTNFYNPDASRLARTGRTSGIGFFIGEVIGFALSIRILPIILIGQAVRFLMDKPSTRYYYLKPAMPLFWNALSTMINTYGANRGFISALNPDQYGDELASGLTQQDKDERNRLMPDIYRRDGGIDIYNIGTRFQRLSNARLEKIEDIRSSAANIEEAKEKYRAFLESPLLEPQGRPLQQYMAAYFGQKGTQPQPAAVRTTKVEKPPTVVEADNQLSPEFISETAETWNALIKPAEGADPTLGDNLLAEFRDGSQFITLRVDDPGSISESFSNSTKESALASTINSMSTGAKEARFSFANGNVSDGIIGQTVGAIAQFAGDILSGAAYRLGVSGLASLAGNALVDIPKHWDQSTSNLPKMTYSIQLRTPYGNEMSRFQNLIVPLFYLLAGALPLSTGAQSYTSPFLCEVYCQGRAQTRLGMIDSLEITRGTAGVGFTEDGKPLGIDISFSIVDMSSVMHMPITAQFNPLEYLIPGGLSRMFSSDDNAFGDYMAILSGLGLTDQIYPLRKLKRNYYKNVLDFQNWTSASHMANWIGDWGASRIISGLYNATDRGNPAASL